jgi:uncharacterized membrane protein
MRDRLIYEFMTDDDLLRISKKIEALELKTSGEVVVSIKERAPLFGGDFQAEAEKEFERLGLAATRDKTGVLFYVNLERRAFVVLADSGVNEKIDPSAWNQVAEHASNRFQDGEFGAGILEALEEIGEKLAGPLPVKPDDVNEIPNRAIVRR